MQLEEQPIPFQITLKLGLEHTIRNMEIPHKLQPISQAFVDDLVQVLLKVMDYLKKPADYRHTAEFQVIVVYKLQPVNTFISSKPQELEGLKGFLPTQSVRQHPRLCLVREEERRTL